MENITLKESNNVIERERIEWIDTLKGFAIFCVVLGHLNMWLPIEKWIYSFHMFLFFFISGFLFSGNKPQKEILKKRVKRILIPFIAWNSVSALIGFVLNGNFSGFLRELFVWNGDLTWNAPIWFLLVLFIAESFIILLKLYKNKWLTLVAIVICLCLWVLIGDKWLLWKLNLVPMAISFFLLGVLLKPIIPKISKWYILIFLGIGSVVFSMLNIRIVYTYCEFGNYIYCMLSAICGVLFFVGLFSKIKALSRLSFLKTWGKNSLIIMASQWFVFKVITYLSIKLFNVDLMTFNSSLVSLILAIVITLIINLLVVLFKKYTKNIKFIRCIAEVFGVQY